MAERRFTTWSTHHGPIVRAADGTWNAMALMNTPVAALQQSWLRTRAHDLASHLEVAGLQANSSNNTLCASDSGENTHLPPHFLPVRAALFHYPPPVADPKPP